MDSPDFEVLGFRLKLPTGFLGFQLANDRPGDFLASIIM